MVFRALVLFKRYEENIKRESAGGLPRKSILIRVQDIETRRVHCLWDWSGDLDNAKLMESCRDQTLEVIGYINPSGKINFTVLERWGIWSEDERRTSNPTTRKYGYVQVSVGHLKDKSGKA